MDEMLSEYLPILIFLAIALALGLLLLLSATIIALETPILRKYLLTNVALMHLMMRE